jgi:hypothetical protein
MKKLIYTVMAVLIITTGCSKKEKKFIPLSILQGDSSGTTASSVSGSASGTGSLVRISVSPAESSIAKDTNASYTATAIYSDGSIKDVTADSTWSVTANEDKAQVDTTKKGRFLGVSSGQSKINATFDSLSGDANLNITSATLVSIDVSRNASLSSGSTAQYYATGIFSDGTTQDISSLVTWTTENSSVVNINSSGATTEVGPGSTVISASLQGKKGSTNTTVTSITVSYITVAGLSSLAAGTSTSYQAIATYSNGTVADVTSQCIWNVDNTANATVSNTSGSKGLLSSLVMGSVNVQATYLNITGAKDVSVTAATVNSLTITPTVSIIKGTTYQYTATATYSDGTTQNVSNSAIWSSSDSAVVGIATSVTNGGYAQGLSTGNAVITANFGGKSATSNFTVNAATLVSISIGGNANVSKGESKQYTATGTYSDGSSQDITSLVSWSSSTTSVVSISNAAQDKGKAYADGVGTSTITASLSGVTGTGSITVTGVPTTQTVSGYNVSLPGQLSTTSAPSGDFTGIAYNGATNAAGFISAVPDYGQSSCSTLGAYVLELMINDNPDVITASNQVSSSTTNFTGGCTSVYNLTITTSSTKKPTELSNHLIQEIGVNVANGTVTSLPSNQATESATNSFRVILQVTYNAGGSEIIGVGVSSTSEYAANEAILVGFLNGTNISSTSTTFANKTDSFTGVSDPLVDFVWVVDNSSSMSGEQSAVVSNSATFFNKLSNKHLDFRLAVITTGHNGGSTSSNANYKCKALPTGSGVKLAYELWGTGWTTAADGASAFQSNVSSVGIAGCGSDETAIHWAQRALGVGGTATIVPRSGAKLIFVILSDEGDGYGTFNNGATYNTTDNIFVTNGYKVYSIIGLHDGSLTNTGVSLGMPGKCDSNTSSSTAPKATSSNNTKTTYYNLSAATGGSSGSICTSDYSTTMDNIVTQAAGNSGYALSRTPLSSSIVVKVNGVTVSQDATNGWQYNSSSKTIVFSGTAWPSAGSSITVTYDYDTSSVALRDDGESDLMAYISSSSENRTARNAAAGIALLVGAILAARMWNRKKK